MGRVAGRRCARAGCRAWALRGGETCRAHTARAAGLGGREEGGGARRESGGAVGAATLLQWMAQKTDGQLSPSTVRRILAEIGREGSLTEEIGALRALLNRLMDEEEDTQRLSESIPRVVNATVRALKAQHVISGETAGDLTEVLTRVLLDMGLGE